MVGAIHSILPDHWVPLAVVGRTQGWSLLRVARTSGLAAAGHVLTSVVLAGFIALIGLQFQKQIETQQGHIVGGLLVLTGAGFLIWGMSGRAHPHAHSKADPNNEVHEHEHQPGVPTAASGSHEHEHAHAGVKHSHRHDHEAFVQWRADLIARRSEAASLGGRLAAVAVPFGVAASPDLTFLPLAAGASAYGGGAVALVLGVFAVVTMIVFVGLTVIATAAGYQMRGEWLEDHANTITAVLLIAIGAVAFAGL